MKENSCRGWKDVFSFTLTQTLKSKPYLIAMAIMLVFSLLSIPLLGLITKNPAEEGAVKSNITKAYVSNQTPYTELAVGAELATGYEGIVIELLTESEDIVMKRLAEEEVSAVLISITDSGMQANIRLLKSPEGPVKNYELQTLGESVQRAYQKAKMTALGVTEEQLAYLSVQVLPSAGVIDTKQAEVVEDTSITMGEYWFIYGLMFVIIMVSILSSTQVASSVVVEKSSKVLEYILISVRPLAIIVGKVLAMLVATLLQMLMLILGLVVSNKISVGITGEENNVLAQYLSPEIMSNLNPGNVIIGLVVAGIGMVLYATLAGLCGATVSRMEEVNECLTVLTVATLVGFYIGMMAADGMMASGTTTFSTFALLFPLSSAFLLPGALLVGKVDLWILLLSVLILIISVMAMFAFVAKVYESLILHNGKRIRMKELLTIFKNSGKEATAENE